MTDLVEAVVIGAGVVGLACARELARNGKEVVVLETHDSFGTETSARNSEVIHAGIYYPAGSLKATLCVTGRAKLYAFCERYNVDYRRCGKLIVATTEAQVSRLYEIRNRAIDNGVTDLQIITEASARKIEPTLRCTAALLSPSTGIVDSHGLMLALLGDAERHGAVLATRSPVLSITSHRAGFDLEIGGAVPAVLRTSKLINSAGLWAPHLASRISGLDHSHVPGAYFAKGNYFSLSGKSPFSRLVYPVPEPGGLGVHLTIDLGGQARFGPDVEWINEVDYSVQPSRAERFYDEIRKYWPDLPDNALYPAYAGIRPKITQQGQPDADFQIQGPSEHGVSGLVNLFGIESPGLTSSLAIAELACKKLFMQS